MTGVPEPQLRPEPPPTGRRPQTLGGAIYLLVAIATAAGVAMIAFGPWRTGLAWMGLALLGASLARMMLRDGNAGMLKVRRKSFDVALTFTIGLGLVVLAVAVPAAPL